LSRAQGQLPSIWLARRLDGNQPISACSDGEQAASCLRRPNRPEIATSSKSTSIFSERQPAARQPRQICKLKKLIPDIAKRLALFDELEREEKAERYEKLCKRLDQAPWDDMARAERDEIYPRIDEPKKVVTPMHIENTESEPVNAGELAMDALNAKAAELQKANPKLSFAQAFEKVYTDRANSDLVLAERHSNSIYEPRELELLKAITKSAKGLPDMASLKPDDLGQYFNGKGTDFPSTQEVMRLIRQEQAKGYSYEMATTRVGAALIEAARRVESEAREASGVRT
jgi:hypothetical protein